MAIEKMHFIAHLFKASSLKKNRPLTCIVWVQGMFEKNIQKKGLKNEKKLRSDTC